LRTPAFSGKPLEIPALVHRISAQWKDLTFVSNPPRFNLVIPTSLCSGQIGLMIANAANRQIPEQRCVALPHTEGCGNSVGESERLMLRTLAAYAVHPLARRVLMLEHGCEKTHNDAFRNVLAPEQTARLGWLSVQLDGGIEPVVRKAVKWFSEAPASNLSPEAVPLSSLRIGFVSNGRGPLQAFMLLPYAIADLGAMVVAPDNFEEFRWSPTIDYGQPAPARGLHVMRAPTEDLTEILTGLGATGVQLIVLWNDGPPVQHHPFIPVLEINSRSFPQKEEATRDLLSLILRAASGEIVSALPRHADFQITRGLEGVSL
jgi:hypothetical protein